MGDTQASVGGQRQVWMNGTFVDGDQATVPLLSHSFSRGSAIFETLGVRVGPTGAKAFRLDKHLQRLQRSASLLGMELGYDSAEIFAGVAETVRLNQPGRGLVKIMAYWGEEAIVSLVPSAKLDVAIFAIAAGGEVQPDDVTPISACLSKWRKLHPDTVAVEAKVCANYLNGYLARKDAMDRGFDIGFLLDATGRLAEGSTESVFVVQDGVLYTPRLGHILQSISRLTILEIAAECGLQVHEADLWPQDLATAQEIFTSHSGVKVHPVGRYEDRDLQAPGPVSAQLIQVVDDMMNFRDTRFGHYFQPLT